MLADCARKVVNLVQFRSQILDFISGTSAVTASPTHPEELRFFGYDFERESDLS
jgi:hypothetical protein